MGNPLGYTTRANVESYLGRIFDTVDNTQFNGYISQAEAIINNYLGYNAATTTSGLLSESITREKVVGKIDSFDNLVIDVSHPPIHFDANNNPLISLLEFNVGSVRVSLQLTDGTTNSLNTVFEVSENRRKIVYPSLYFFPAVSAVTPTRKVNLYNLRDVKFWIDVSYIGGYDTVPADITAAANMICADLLTDRDNPTNANAIRQGSYSVSFDDTKTTPAIKRAMMLLQPYVRVGW